MFKSKQDTSEQEPTTSAERAAWHAGHAERLLASAPAMSKHAPIAQVHATLAVYWQHEAQREAGS